MWSSYQSLLIRKSLPLKWFLGLWGIKANWFGPLLVEIEWRIKHQSVGWLHPNERRATEGKSLIPLMKYPELLTHRRRGRIWKKILSIWLMCLGYIELSSKHRTVIEIINFNSTACLKINFLCFVLQQYDLRFKKWLWYIKVTLKVLSQRRSFSVWFEACFNAKKNITVL